MGLSTEVVDLRGENLGEDVYEVGAVREIAVVQLKLVGSWGMVNMQVMWFNNGDARSC